jgi:phenylacetyl-CoA:acceptor oxidoreductase
MHWWDKQLEEYQALPAWRDFAAPWVAAVETAGGKPQDYPFWLLTARSMQYAWGGNAGMQLMKELADNVTGHRGVIMNAGAAADLGIADGDPVEIATPRRSVWGRAVLRQGIRPDTLLMIGQFDHWATPVAKDFGVPSLNALATMSMDLTDATGSGADIVRVRVAKAAARAASGDPRGKRVGVERKASGRAVDTLDNESSRRRKEAAERAGEAGP